MLLCISSKTFVNYFIQILYIHKKLLIIDFSTKVSLLVLLQIFRPNSFAMNCNDFYYKKTKYFANNGLIILGKQMKENFTPHKTNKQKNPKQTNKKPPTIIISLRLK